MGDDSIVEAIGMGSILVEVMVKGRIKRIRIKDVLHVPKLHANLLSVSKILSSGCKVQFNMNECIVRAFDGEVIAIALPEGNLYQMTFTKVCKMHVANLAQTSTIDGALELWHRRLGHLSIKGVHALHKMVSGVNLGNMQALHLHLFVKGALRENNIANHFQAMEGCVPPSRWRLCIRIYAAPLGPHPWVVQGTL
jgi:hypothetical protein